MQFKEVLKKKKKKKKKKKRKHLRGSEEEAKKKKKKKEKKERLKENGRYMKILVEVRRELKTGKLTDQIWKIIKVYDAVTFLKVHEFFSLCSGQPWMFLQFDV